MIRPTGLKLQVRLLRAQHGPEGHQGNRSMHAACPASLDYMRRAPLHAAQVVLSFHACGGNVGDTAHVPLPQWVLRCGENDPDLFFTDRPRGGSRGQRNREYLSVWADDAQGVLHGRSPMQCYEDFMASFRDNFLQVTGHPCAQTRAAVQQPCSDCIRAHTCLLHLQDLGGMVEEVVVGAGPCGELRFPSYVEANGWRFPGVGEFQVRHRALAAWCVGWPFVFP